MGNERFALRIQLAAQWACDHIFLRPWYLVPVVEILGGLVALHGNEKTDFKGSSKTFTGESDPSQLLRGFASIDRNEIIYIVVVA